MNGVTSEVSEDSGFIEEGYPQLVESRGIDVCHEDLQIFVEAIEVDGGKRREDRACRLRQNSTCLVIRTVWESIADKGGREQRLENSKNTNDARSYSWPAAP